MGTDFFVLWGGKYDYQRTPMIQIAATILVNGTAITIVRFRLKSKRNLHVLLSVCLLCHFPVSFVLFYLSVYSVWSVCSVRSFCHSLSLTFSISLSHTLCLSLSHTLSLYFCLVRYPFLSLSVSLSFFCRFFFFSLSLSLSLFIPLFLPLSLSLSLFIFPYLSLYISLSLSLFSLPSLSLSPSWGVLSPWFHVSPGRVTHTHIFLSIFFPVSFPLWISLSLSIYLVFLFSLSIWKLGRSLFLTKSCQKMCLVKVEVSDVSLSYSSKTALSMQRRNLKCLFMASGCVHPYLPYKRQPAGRRTSPHGTLLTLVRVVGHGLEFIRPVLHLILNVAEDVRSLLQCHPIPTSPQLCNTKTHKHSSF